MAFPTLRVGPLLSAHSLQLYLSDSSSPGCPQSKPSMALSSNLPPCFGPCFISCSNENENHLSSKNLQNYSKCSSDLFNSVSPVQSSYLKSVFAGQKSVCLPSQPERVPEGPISAQDVFHCCSEEAGRDLVRVTLPPVFLSRMHSAWQYSFPD